MCTYCTQRTTERQEAASRPIKLHTPFSSATVTSLVQEVKSTRALLKDREAQLKVIERKLATGAEDVSDDVKVCTILIYIFHKQILTL